MQRILLIDNYDSFTYNLVESFRRLDGCTLEVVTHDRVELPAVADYDRIVFSPGPGLPDEYPAMFRILEEYHREKPILGICLGHQAIARYFGARLGNLPGVLHGRSVEIEIRPPVDRLFQGIPRQTTVGLYHSWEVRDYELPGSLRVTATGPGGIIMGLAHTAYDIRGVQFHPESFITREGGRMLGNWVKG